MAIGNQENWAIIFQLVPLDFWVNTPENIDKESPVIRFSLCDANFFHFLSAFGLEIIPSFLKLCKEASCKIAIIPESSKCPFSFPKCIKKRHWKKRFNLKNQKKKFHNFYDYFGFYCPIVHNWLHLKLNAPRFFASFASTDLK